jgi:hypothetical protein
MAPLLIDHGCRSSRRVTFLRLVAFSSKVAHLPTVEAWKVTINKLLWWPNGSLLWWWSRGTVELLLLRLLLLELMRLELSAIAPILLLLWSMQLTPGGVYTMRYLGGASLELLLLADPGIILFIFFSMASAMAFIIHSWSMATFGNSLYDKLANYTRCSCRWMVSPARYRLPSSHSCRRGRTCTKQDC